MPRKGPSGVYPLAVQPRAPAPPLKAQDAVRDEVLADATRLVVAVLSQRPFRVPLTAAELRHFAAQAQALVDLEDKVDVTLAAQRARDRNAVPNDATRDAAWERIDAGHREALAVCLKARNLAQRARIGLENAALALEALDRGDLDGLGVYAANLRYFARRANGP